jgi:hypothetical protein
VRPGGAVAGPAHAAVRELERGFGTPTWPIAPSILLLARARLAFGARQRPCSLPASFLPPVYTTSMSILYTLYL